jgi:4-amino-4-deoxy-L-arabinose transferase-like glycosyltransferase
VLFSDSFPWSSFLFASALADWRARRSTAPDERVTRLRTLLWLWIIVIVAFFSLSAAKQDLYIFPIVPAVAALAGVVIARGLSQEPRASRAIRITAATVGIIVAVTAAGVVYLFRAGGTGYALDGAMTTGIVGVAGGACVTVLALTFRLPSFEAYKPSPGFARTLDGRLTRETVVATYDEALPSLVFYLQRHVDQLFAEDQLMTLLRSDRPVYAVLSGRSYAALSKSFDLSTCVIERRPTFDVKLKTVLTREPMPELVLITNRCEP